MAVKGRDSVITKRWSLHTLLRSLSSSLLVSEEMCANGCWIGDPCKVDGLALAPVLVQDPRQRQRRYAHREQLVISPCFGHAFARNGKIPLVILQRRHCCL